MKKDILLSAALAVALPASGTAQAVFAPVSREVSASAPSLDLKRAIVADIDGSLFGDLIQIAGQGTPQIGHSIGLTTAVFPAPFSANDITEFPGGVATPATLIAVSAAGVTLLTDYSAGSFTETLFTPSGWLDAGRVIVADYDGDQFYDLAGVGSNGSTILTLDKAFTPSQTARSWTPPGTVHNIAVADWFGDGKSRVLVLTDSGLLVYGKRGVLLDSIAFGCSAGFLVPMSQAGHTGERVAAIYRSGASWNLVAMDRSTTEIGITFPGLDVYSATSGDIDNDGADDLVIAHRTAETLLVHYNQSDGVTPPGTIETFNSSGETITYGSSVTLNTNQHAWPVLYDFDRDGDLDCSIYAEAGDDHNIAYNTTIDDPLVQRLTHIVVTLDETVTPQLIQMVLKFNSSSGAVLVKLWEQPDPTTTSTAQVLAAAVGTVVNGEAIVTFDLGSDVDEVFGQVINIEACDVVLDATGTTVISAGLVEISSLTLDGDLSASNVAANPGTSLNEIVDVFNTTPAGTVVMTLIDGRDLVPGTICIPDVPDFEEPPVHEPEGG